MPSPTPKPVSPAALRTTILNQLTQDPDLPQPVPTKSLWQVPGNSAVANAQSTNLPQYADYVIIGSGIAGVSVARTLLSHAATGTKTVAVLEARTLCSGATGRNGGQLTRLPPTRHAYMVEQFGLAEANKIMRLTVHGLREMHAATEAHGDTFKAFTRVTRLEKFFAYFDQQSWNETLAALRYLEEQLPEDHGAYQIVSKEEAESKYKLKGVCGGLKLSAGTVSPYNLVTGLFQKLLEKFPTRFTIDTNTAVTRIEYVADADATQPYRLHTPRGVVHAANIIHCTNGYAGHLVPGLRGKLYPRRGTMSVQNPGARFPDMSAKQSWSFYFTPSYNAATGAVETGRYYGYHHKDTGDLWVGGDRDAIDGFITSDDSAVDGHADASLRQLVPKLFSDKWVDPQQHAVRAIWSGIMCYTADQLPLVGRLPSSETGRAGTGEWIAAGWNTYGMTNGLVCGDALGKMMLGEDVSCWFPASYLPTDERLNSETFKLRSVVDSYFDRIGAKKYLLKL
ncbi:hypothetical protein SEUCBS139899_009581 [Sporothrix eucalyptigena]